MTSVPPTPRPGVQIRLKPDAAESTRSPLPLPSWSALSGSRGRYVTAEPARGFFRRSSDGPAPGSRRFGELVSAHLGDLDRSTWRRSFRFLRPFGGANQRGETGTVATALAWLFSDDQPESIPHEEEGYDEGEVFSEALLATPELNISEVSARRPSVGATLSPAQQRTRRLPSRIPPRKPPLPPPLSLRRQLGISRFAVGLLILLLLFGLYEVLVGGETHRRGRPTAPVLTSRWVHSPRTLLRTLHLPNVPEASKGLLTWEQREQLNTTAIVLTYRRRSNLLAVLAHLCQYTNTIFRDVLIWNNDPSRPYTLSDFSATGCPEDTLRIYNSPANMLFVARYLACSMSVTPHCYFQDDDWLVWPLRTMHAQFMREPEGPSLVSAGSLYHAERYAWTWCFFQEPLLHSCFAWLGAGSFVSRSHVLDFLDSGVSATNGVPAMTKDAVGLADNAFTTLRNIPPYTLQHRQIQLVTDGGRGFSDGSTGETRNQRYIAQGVERLLAMQTAKWHMDADVPEFQLEADYRGTPSPPSLPHPHAHHSRAPCHDDTCLFITNVAILPPPGRSPLTTSKAGNFSLAKWEVREKEDWADLLRWSREYPYYAAVDDDYLTVWRSADVIRRGDYIGLMLVDSLAADQSVVFNVALDEADDVLAGGLDVEISRDGYTWLNVPGVSWTCRTSPHRAHPPHDPFPRSPMLSPLGVRLLSAESTWATQRRRRGERLRICTVSLSSSLPRRSLDEPEADKRGWRFVRASYEGTEGVTASVGWGIAEVWLTLQGS